MGQKTIFDGKIYTEPTAQARIIGGVGNNGAPSSFGNICIIDTGLGAGYGGGRGILDSGSNARPLDEHITQFNSSAEMKEFVKGGVLYDLADYLYNPTTSGAGASTVFLIKAAQTDQAQSSTAGWANAFSLVLNTKDEGLNANGVLNGSDLETGYAWRIKAGILNPAKFIFEFWLGQYRGQDGDGLELGGLTAAQAASAPKLIAESIEVADISELKAWADGNVEFTNNFEFDATSATSGVIAAGDLVTFAGYQLFTGGTELYGGTALDNVLEQIKELDNSLFLSLDNDVDAAGVDNLKILGHIQNDAEFKKFLIIGGGNDSSGFATSKTAAGTLNSRYAVMCHSGIEIPYSLNSAVLQKKSSVYMAALVCGRLAGLEPQVPLTYKNLRINKLRHVLKESERVDLIDSGVLHVRTVPQLGFVVNQAINTLQLNDYLINNDGSSPEISVERIEAQLNREIAANSRVLFIGQNLFTLTSSDLVSFTIGYLNQVLAVAGVTDGLIVDFGNVKAVRTGSTWEVTYDFQANTPINKVFHTGTIIDPTL
jgi:hypothetical protein